MTHTWEYPKMVIVFLLWSCKIRPPPTQSHLSEVTCFFRGFNSASSHFSKTSAWYPAKVYPLTRYFTWSPLLTLMRTYLKRPVSMSTGGKDSIDMILFTRISEWRRRQSTADRSAASIYPHPAWLHHPPHSTSETHFLLSFTLRMRHIQSIHGRHPGLLLRWDKYDHHWCHKKLSSSLNQELNGNWLDWLQVSALIADIAFLQRKAIYFPFPAPIVDIQSFYHFRRHFSSNEQPNRKSSPFGTTC